MFQQARNLGKGLRKSLDSNDAGEICGQSLEGIIKSNLAILQWSQERGDGKGHTIGA